MPPSRRVKCSQTRYSDPKLSTVHQTGASPKPSFEGFEGTLRLRVSENSLSVTGEESSQGIQWGIAEKTKTAIANPQNPQNLNDGRVLADLRSRCLAYVPPERWRQTVADSESFVAQWGEQAKALEWSSRDLWGLHQPPENPHPSYSRLSRYDQTGLLWLLGGQSVTALSSETAVIRSASGSILKYRKSNKPAIGPLGDSLENFWSSKRAEEAGR